MLWQAGDMAPSRRAAATAVCLIAAAAAAAALPAAGSPVEAPVVAAGRAARGRRWGPPHLEEVCHPDVGCHRFGKISAPLDHDDPSQGEWDLVYFVNSNFWDPVAKPNAPIFINMGYGPTTAPDYTRSALFHVDDDHFQRYYVGTSFELAIELGALIINVPNRYYGCDTARAELPEGSCPASLAAIPKGEDGVLEAHDRLRWLSLKSVVDDIAFVARSTITEFAEDWGMAVP